MLDTEVSHHLLRVVGIAPLEQVELFDGQGLGCVACLQSVQNGLAEMAWVSTLKTSTTAFIDPRAVVDQRRCFWHRASDVYRNGADTFIPLQAHRSIPKGDKQSRWLKIVNGAAAQSKRLITPKVVPLQTWKTLAYP